MTINENINDPAFPLPPRTPTESQYGTAYIPGHRTRAERHRPGNTGAFSTTEGPAPRPEPKPEDDGLRTFERALDIVKNVVVIVTCLVLLYGAWSVYSALAEFSDRVGQFVQ